MTPSPVKGKVGRPTIPKKTRNRKALQKKERASPPPDKAGEGGSDDEAPSGGDLNRWWFGRDSISKKEVEKKKSYLR